MAAVENGHHIWLIIFAVLCAAISAYYYFKIIQAMYFKEGDAQVMEISSPFKWTLVMVASLVVLLGVFPSLLMNWFYF